MTDSASPVEGSLRELAPRGKLRGGALVGGSLGTAVLLLVWQGLVWIEVTSPLILPPPSEVVRALIRFRAAVWSAFGVTLGEVLVGFGLAVAVGVLLAVILTYSRGLRSALYPVLVILYSIPKIAIAPILVLWFGFGFASRVVVAFLVAFFPVVVETASGLRSVDPELHDLARTLDATRVKTFLKIDFPASLPSMIAGMKVAITLSVIGAIVGEFIAAQSGLGFLLQTAISQQVTDLALGVALVISLMSLVLFGLVSVIGRLITPWHPTSTHHDEWRGLM